MTSWTETERAALVETLRGADPDGPTLCAGWTTRHLLAHLVLRERAPIRNVADMLARREPGDERFLSRWVSGAASAAGYERLLEQLAAGPSRRNPMGWAGDGVYLMEYVIHHEDVRRAKSPPAGPRLLPDGQAQAIWRRLAGPAKLVFRGSQGGAVLATPDGQRMTVRSGPDPVTITGDPVELALHVSGREAAARVTISGRVDR